MDHKNQPVVPGGASDRGWRAGCLRPYINSAVSLPKLPSIRICGEGVCLLIRLREGAGDVVGRIGKIARLRCADWVLRLASVMHVIVAWSGAMI